MGIVVLPAKGREGETPSWPLSGRPRRGEAGCWAELWTSPQAVAWEQLGWTRVVARYCRILVEAERPEAHPNVRAEARQLEDRLGLTPKSMRMLLWVIAEDELEKRRDAATGTDGRAAGRSRMRAVDSPED